MNIVVENPVSAICQESLVTVHFRSGHSLSFPIEGNARLENATALELNQIELSPFGLHWPALDEDLSFEGIMRGNYGQR